MVRPRSIPLLLLLTAGLLACGGESSGPSGGSLVVTVSGLPANSAAAVVVTGPGGFTRTITASQTFNGLAEGGYTVAASSVTASGDAYSPVPPSQTVTVSAGEAPATAAVAYALEPGALAVTIAGLPDGSAAAVSITGPGGYSQAVAASDTLNGLVPGSYTVTASNVTSGGTQYSASPPTQSVSVAGGSTSTASVSYTSSTAGALNLRIAGMYLTQSVQTFAGGVPLVRNRDGYLRVFVIANTANTAAPVVRVRFYISGALASTKLINPPGLTVPQAPDESTLSSSWNVAVAGSLIQPGLAIVADVDPANVIAEADETDNGFPVSGTPQATDVRTTASFNVTLLPIKQSANNLQGNVTDANKAQFLATTMRVHPLAAYNAQVHAVYTTTSAPADASDPASWTTLLGEVNAVRTAEGTGRFYYGVVKVSYSSGIAGIGYVGTPSAVGWDYLPSGSDVAAHEWGHNWGRSHSPCGTTSTIDPQYPYPGGTIGVYGFDVAGAVVEPPSEADIMSYCHPQWISDYTYLGVLQYRASTPAVAGTSQAVQPCLLVWGRIENGQPMLEPAFQVLTRPSLPSRRGPYTVEGLSASGPSLFTLDFQAQPVADAASGAEHFAFAVPLSDARAAQLSAVRLRAMGREVVIQGHRAAAAAPQFSATRSAPGRVALLWDASANPMLMVRDPASGQVLSFARGGRADLAASGAALELVASDRVKSRAFRVTVPGR